ncbi:MAG: helix-turn-helix domain-containing protein [Streptococcaceae bacterium]|nr:helix-turn-helix domain-containing protein [Streptococcaceae bacterium]
MTEKLNRSFPIKKSVSTSAADTLAQALKEHNMSQKEFAMRLGVSQPYISDILNRRKFLTDELAIKIEMVTGISAEFLLRHDFAYKMTLMELKRNTIEPLEYAFG